MKSDKKGLLLYAVTDRSWLNGETLYSQVEKALQGGATFIQLREKNLDQDHFMEEALELKKLCAAYHVPFVINDYVEIAAKMDADGVHVGQSDMEAQDVRAILGPDKILGVSAQTVEQGVVERIRQRSARPAENGTSPGGAAITRADVASMTRAQREALERRAMHGVKISF